MSLKHNLCLTNINIATVLVIKSLLYSEGVTYQPVTTRPANHQIFIQAGGKNTKSNILTIRNVRTFAEINNIY